MNALTAGCPQPPPHCCMFLMGKIVNCSTRPSAVSAAEHNDHFILTFAGSVHMLQLINELDHIWKFLLTDLSQKMQQRCLLVCRFRVLELKERKRKERQLFHVRMWIIIYFIFCKPDLKDWASCCVFHLKTSGQNENDFTNIFKNKTNKNMCLQCKKPVSPSRVVQTRNLTFLSA